MDTKKRVSLYFNLELEDERLMYEKLSKTNKSRYIKSLIMNDINKVSYLQPVVNVTTEKTDTLDDVDFNSNEIDFDEE
ncbi:hypothetical protein [Clostridium botulinum]|uniref:hypothetical protein n=1 Tax=Clostridium botulinum TaxID=1491 RepID=UPI001967CD5E|nr:hypothetical protein [Clostridium botulinum]MBN1079249.1 hypothetical protein [Clostridium botulinum]